MSAEVLKIAPTSDLRVGDIFCPAKWAGSVASSKEYVVCEGHLLRYWDAKSGVQFDALPLHMFMSPQQVYGPARKRALLSFRETAGMIFMRGNLLGDKRAHIPAVGASIICCGRKRRNGTRSTKSALVHSVMMTSLSSTEPLSLVVRTDRHNTLSYYPRREVFPHYKIVSDKAQRLAL